MNETIIEQQFEPMPTVGADDVVSPEEGLGIMRRLVQALQLADQALSGELRGRIWTVYGIVGDAPSVKSFDDTQALCKFINDLRAQQNKDRENRYFLRVFYGQQWQIQKGRVWHLWDGKSLTPIVSADPPTAFIDDSGSLLEQSELLDAVLSDRPETPNEMAESQSEVVGPEPSEEDEESEEEPEINDF